MKTFLQFLTENMQMPHFNFADWSIAMDWAEEHNNVNSFVYWLYSCYREEFGRTLENDLVPNAMDNQETWERDTIENAIVNVSYVFMEVLAQDIFALWNEVVNNCSSILMNVHNIKLRKYMNWLRKSTTSSKHSSEIQQEAIHRLETFISIDEAMWAEVPKRFKGQIFRK